MDHVKTKGIPEKDRFVRAMKRREINLQINEANDLTGETLNIYWNLIYTMGILVHVINIYHFFI